MKSIHIKGSVQIWMGALSLLLLFQITLLNAQRPIFRDSHADVKDRVNDLLSSLTTQEKIALIGYRNKAIPRLGIPAYNWWNEALHGVARAGEATVFPQAIAMAASFNPELLQSVASVISTEARAKYNLAQLAKAQDRQYLGLTFWTPNINIFRDPRWGRGQETYGEDPFLTGLMGSAFVRGLQGSDLEHLKVSACAKHLVAYSGPESERHSFNAVVSETDLRNTYLYAFKKLVDAGVESVMCAYNRVNGQPCCINSHLITDILKGQWHFNGHLVTDCWALEDIWARHKYLPNSLQVAAAAIRAGINLDCSNLLQDNVMQALQEGLITSKELDSALRPVLTTEVKLGFFDDRDADPYRTYGADSISNDYHRRLSRLMAEESMVLMKNDSSLLPLKPGSFSSIMVVGPNAANDEPLLGNYHGVNTHMVNFVEGITSGVPLNCRVEYDQGCDFSDTVHFGGIWGAGNADLTVAVLGLNALYEGEEGDAFLSKHGGDRADLKLPASEIAYLKALRKGTAGKPLIVVIAAGSALDLSDIVPFCDAVIYAWYPGEQGGKALADILFGKVSPSGHLPLTFYKDIKDLPSFESYAMKGRTYRYFNRPVAYPFGYGLSYTQFAYENITGLKTVYHQKDSICLNLTVKNIGKMDGKELVQLYVKYPDNEQLPIEELKAIKKIRIAKGEQSNVRLSIPVSELLKWDETKNDWRLYPGKYSVFLGRDAVSPLWEKTFEIR